MPRLPLPLVAAPAALLLLLPACAPVHPPATPAAQKALPPADTLRAITARGRRLAAFDRAAWLGTDAVRELNPDTEGLQRYLVRETPEGGWVVAFGRLTPERDRFVTRYEAREERPGAGFKARRLNPETSDTAYFRVAALAQDLANQDFGTPNRPYNVAVIPVSSDGGAGWWVYFLPAPTQAGVTPHGGDVRYRVSPDGTTIVEKRRMHRSVLDFGTPPESVEMGFHTAIVDDLPEDSDVFLVLSRGRRYPEMVVSQSFEFLIQPDGTISCTFKRDDKRR